MIVWIDAGNGAAGDMLLAALIDAGADLADISAGLAGLAIEPIGLDVTTVRRHGLRARRVVVVAPPSRHSRRLGEVLSIVDAGGLPDRVASFAHKVFHRLAKAEATVHGTDPAEVHFHEVGALDAIADVVGCGLAIESLDLWQATVVVSPVAVGSGHIHTAHGRLPVPPPAVLELLSAGGVPVAEHPGPGELCTPTGAALLTTLATRYGHMPAMTLVRNGTGAGTADPAAHPNVLRLIVGTPAGAAHTSWTTSEMVVVETTVDDLDPRLWPDVLTTLRGAGAADAWYSPVVTRNGRPGHTLTVLTMPEYVDLLSRLVFQQTATLGLRVHGVSRRSLPRDRVTVDFGDVEVGVKRGHLDGVLISAEPEYDDARRAAIAADVPIRHVLAAVRGAAGGEAP